MSATKGKAYIDAMASYMAPRIIGALRAFGVKGSTSAENIANGIYIFPNPAQDEITLRNADPRNPLLKVEIMDQRGKLVYGRSVNQAPSIRIHRQNWPKGLYTLRLYTEDEGMLPQAQPPDIAISGHLTTSSTVSEAERGQ